ncbi:MAG TPA: hypothetical protein VGF14_00630 [Alphaproteobacteria bacterium]
MTDNIDTKISALETHIARLNGTIEPVVPSYDIAYERDGLSDLFVIKIGHDQISHSLYDRKTKILHHAAGLNGLTAYDQLHYRSMIADYKLDENNVFNLVFMGISKKEVLPPRSGYKDIHGYNSVSLYNSDERKNTQNLVTDLLHNDIYASYVADQALNGPLLGHLALAMYVYETRGAKPLFDHANLDDFVYHVMRRKHFSPRPMQEEKSRYRNVVQEVQEDRATQAYEFGAIGRQAPLKMTKSIVTQYQTTTSRPGHYTVTNIFYDKPSAGMGGAAAVPSFVMTESEAGCKANVTGGFGSIRYDSKTGNCKTEIINREKLGEAWRFISDPRVKTALASVVKFNPDMFHQNIQELTLAYKKEIIAPFHEQLNLLKREKEPNGQPPYMG